MTICTSADVSDDVPMSATTVDVKWRRPRDGGWGWVVVLASFFIHVIADGVTYSFGVFAVDLIADFGVTREQIGWINSLTFGLTLGAGPIASILSMKIGNRLMTIIGATVAFIGFGLAFFATQLWHLLLLIGVVTGLGLALVYLPAVVCVGQYFERRRSLAMGLAVCGSGVGTFLIPPTANALIEAYSWRGAILVISGLIFNCSVCGAVFKHFHFDDVNEIDHVVTVPLAVDNKDINHQDDSNHGKQHQLTVHSLFNYARGGAETPNGTHSGVNFASVPQFGANGRTDTKCLTRQTSAPFNIACSSQLGKWSSAAAITENDIIYPPPLVDKPSVAQVLRDMIDISLLRHPIYMLFCVSNFFTMVGFNAPFLYLPDLAVNEGIHPTSAAFLISIIGIGNTIGRVVFGMSGDRSCVNRLYMYSTSLVICGIVTFFMFLYKSHAVLVAYSCIYGLTVGVLVSLTPVLLVDLLDVQRLNSSFGILLLFQGVAVFVGPPLAGYFYDVTGNYNISFMACGGMLALSGAILYPIPLLRKWLHL